MAVNSALHRLFGTALRNPLGRRPMDEQDMYAGVGNGGSGWENLPYIPDGRGFEPLPNDTNDQYPLELLSDGNEPVEDNAAERTRKVMSGLWPDQPQTQTETQGYSESELPTRPRVVTPGGREPIPADENDITARAPVPTVNTVVQREKSRSNQVLDQIDAAKNAPIRQESSMWKRLGSGLWNAFKDWSASGGQGGLGGLISTLAVDGVGFAASKSMQGNYKKNQGINRLWQDYGQAAAVEKGQRDADWETTRTNNVNTDNAQRKTEFDQRMKFNQDDQQRKIDDRTSREATARMNTVAGMLKNLPEFIPGDPKYKEMEKALGEVKLPITEKDAKKQIKLVQHPDTGLWDMIVTDPIDPAKQEVRPVMKDGKQYQTTPMAVIQGEFRINQQNDQQKFQAEQNQLSREQQLKIIAGRSEEKWVADSVEFARKDAIEKGIDPPTAAEAMATANKAREVYRASRLP